MTAEIELAKQHGIQYRLAPEGTTEMWCYDRNLQAFAEAVRAAERERCAKVCEWVASALESAEEDAQAMRTGAQSCADQIRAGA